MAADAYKKLEERMDAAREAEVAAYIMRDIELRQQNAEENGVLAYGRKPIPRSKPNERFLQNTIKSVDFANRKALEDSMWEQWDQRKQRQKPEAHRTKHRGRARSDSEEEANRDGSRQQAMALPRRSPASASRSSPSVSSEGSLDHTSVEEILSKRAIRGRGASGSRADEPGPFLFPTDEQERAEHDMLRYAQKAVAGPERPSWLRSANEGISEQISRPLLNGVAYDEKLKAAKKQARKERKERKKAKKLKKEKKQKRKDLSD